MRSSKLIVKTYRVSKAAICDKIRAMEDKERISKTIENVKQTIADIQKTVKETQIEKETKRIQLSPSSRSL